MNIFKRFKLRFAQFNMWFLGTAAQTLQPMIFISEIPEEQRSQLHKDPDTYCWCRYCNHIFPATDVTVVDNERFACLWCMEKLKKCHDEAS